MVLNAKNDAEEAAIIAEAGRKDAVTVSTQMAGRGTDIRLGGSDGDDAAREEVLDLGGLCVVGTGRYETERLDNQLRGRAGRQGDPGRSVFFSSLEDPLVTKYGDLKREPHSDEPDGRMGPKDAEAVEQAQRVAEGAMLTLHGNTWDYNKQVNEQREAIVRRRMQVLKTEVAAEDMKEAEPERWAETVDEPVLDEAARQIVLFHLDRAWADHLAYVADVQASIHLRALGQQSPLEEFRLLTLRRVHADPGAGDGGRPRDLPHRHHHLGRRRHGCGGPAPVDDDLDVPGASEPVLGRGAQAMQGIVGIFR